MMTDLLVGIGGIEVSCNPDVTILTMALGSCVAIVACDPATGATGMAHVALPGNPRDKNRSKSRGYYADTAVPELIRRMEVAGGPKRGRGLRIKIVGGASILDAVGSFNIGKRNVLAIKRALWRLGLGAIAEDVGGNFSRTVRIGVRELRMWVSSPGRSDWRV